MAIKFFVSAFVDRLTDLRHEIVIEIEVVEHRKTHTEHFVRLEQVADIASGIEAASRTSAVGVDGKGVTLIFLVIDVHRALPSEDIAMARIAGGHHAVKEIHAAVNSLKDIPRCADTHQIARLIHGHVGLYLLDDVIHHLRLLTNGKTADGVTGEVKFADALHVVDADIIVGAALVDTKKHLIFVDRFGQGIEARHLVFAAFEPAGRARNGISHVVTGRGIFDTLVKRHRTGGGDIRLDLHALFRAHEDALTIDVGGKFHAVLIDLAKLGEGEHLKTAAIRKDGACPVEELVDTAHIADDVVTGAKMEVVRIGKLDLTADVVKILRGDTALNGGASADVHEYGGLNRAVNSLKRAAARSSLLL